MASGVSSTTISTPVAASRARMLRPSRPMMRPFTSSLSMWKTLTEFSIAVSVATRCMVWMTIFLACVLALSFASSIISLIYEAALVRASSLRLSTSRLRASSALRPESSSSFSRSLVCILSSSSCLRAMSFFSFSMRCCPCSTSCLRRPISSIRWLSEISRCFSRFSFC